MKSTPFILRETIPPPAKMSRTPGIHISVCIARICLRLAHFQRSSGGMNLSQLELGAAWEYGLINRLTDAYPERFFQIGELECDGLFGTPDIVDFDPLADDDLFAWLDGRPCDMVVEEYKCTWMSLNCMPDDLKFWKFWAQLKAYCHMIGTSTGRLRIVHVNGDYSHGHSSPVVGYREVIRMFTQQELIVNWSLILKESELMEREAIERGFNSVVHEQEITGVERRE